MRRVVSLAVNGRRQGGAIRPRRRRRVNLEPMLAAWAVGAFSALTLVEFPRLVALAVR